MHNIMLHFYWIIYNSPIPLEIYILSKWKAIDYFKWTVDFGYFNLCIKNIWKQSTSFQKSIYQVYDKLWFQCHRKATINTF